MDFAVGCDTDAGAVREQNQDCFILRYSNDARCSSCFAVLCDGMGGLSEGDLASNTVVKALEKWYVDRFEKTTEGFYHTDETVIEELKIVIRYCHDRLNRYGDSKSIKLGTTIAVLLIRNSSFIAMNIGDSRIYYLDDSYRLITKDDTVVNQWIDENKMTPDEAEKSNKKHILTQCIGVGKTPEPHICLGSCRPGCVWFMCSDGMYHVLSDTELKDSMLKQRNDRGSNAMSDLRDMMRTVMDRGERDNLTGIFITLV